MDDSLGFNSIDQLLANTREALAAVRVDARPPVRQPVVRVSSDAGPRIDVTVGASGRVESIIVAENSHQSHLEPLLARIAEIVNGALDDWDQQLLDSVGGLTKEQSAELKESLNSRLLQIQEESVRSMRAVTQSLAEVLRHTKGQGK